VGNKGKTNLAYSYNTISNTILITLKPK